MVKTILLSSTKGGSGKSAIAIGLFLKLKENKFNPGYFKPIGDSMTMEPMTRTDKDVNVITAVVARKFSKEEICPVFLSPDLFLDEVTESDIESINEKVKDAYNSMSKKTDYIIIEGNHSGHQYRAMKFDDAHWAKEFNAEIIICAPISNDDDLNDVISLYDFYKMQNLKIAGVILNGLNEMAFVRIEKYHKPLLHLKGIPVIGGLKESRQLLKPTVAEVMDAINGKLIAGNFIKVKNNMIEGFLIGAMGAESALSYLRKSPDVCVITGGDRSDIVIAALETSPSLIVLTGNIEPMARVKSLAEEKGVPVVLAPGDTFSVAESTRKIHIHIQPNEISICREQVEKYIDWNKIPK